MRLNLQQIMHVPGASIPFAFQLDLSLPLRYAPVMDRSQFITSCTVPAQIISPP